MIQSVAEEQVSQLSRQAVQIFPLGSVSSPDENILEAGQVATQVSAVSGVPVPLIKKLVAMHLVQTELEAWVPQLVIAAAQLVLIGVKPFGQVSTQVSTELTVCFSLGKEQVVQTVAEVWT